MLYHGVLASCAGWRDQVVPAPADHDRIDSLPTPGMSTSPPVRDGMRTVRRYPWADLLRRVFTIDALECPACGGPLRILAAIRPPDIARAILDSLGLIASGLPVLSSRMLTVRHLPDR